MAKSDEVTKCVGQQGYFTKEGRLVFSNATVVLQQFAPVHTFIEGATLCSEREAAILVAANLKVADKVVENAAINANSEKIASEI